ncbi:BnaCnng16350D [Brassica napus]|uniref:(rape) hypothetical protein n=1 Tax=Brassica napus TaxID=3708 RepID=A0A078IEH1_BRANA|nr:unnamed protein product [Brassica napus]CDY48422.1 BnaCnng16350D [Brassica napus]
MTGNFCPSSVTIRTIQNAKIRPELRTPDSDRDPPSSSTATLLIATTRHLSTVASPKTMTKKIDRNTDGLRKLNMISFTIPILFSHKLGINCYGSTVSVAADNLAAHASGSAENRAVEKTAFDVKLEKFETASKIKAMRIQEARRSRQCLNSSQLSNPLGKFLNPPLG